MTQVLPSRTPDERAKAVETAARVLRSGDVVALPTETVYGLAADALNPEAVVKIFEAKTRPRFDPLIVHLPDCEALERVARIDSDARDLIDKLTARFWPGCICGLASCTGRYSSRRRRAGPIRLPCRLPGIILTCSRQPARD